MGVCRGKDLLGQRRIRDGAGQLQGADEQCEQADRALLRPLRIAVVKVPRDGRDHRLDTDGVCRARRLVATADLVEQGGRRATAGAVVAVCGERYCRR